MNSLLKIAEYYKLCLAEKFSIKQLEAEPGFSSKIRYCNINLPLVGKGGSRNAYRLSSKKALKIAKESTGIVQNENEFLTLTYIKSKILPKIYNAGKDFSWMEVELVRPIYSWLEFEQLSGIESEEFVYMMTKWKVYDFPKNELQRKYAGNEFLQELSKLVARTDQDTKEFLTRGNFGKNSDGRLVILDLGFFVGYD